MAHGALFGFRQRLALFEAAHRRVGDEAGVWVAQHFGGLRVHRHFDDALAQRLFLVALERQEQTALDARLRSRLRFHYFDPRRGPLDRAKVIGGLFDFVFAHALGDGDHGIGVGLARLGTLAVAVSEIHHLLDEIRVVQPAHAGVFGAALAVRVMAQRARTYVRPLAVGHDVGHLRVIFGIPIGGPETVGNLRACEFQIVAGKVARRGVGRGRRCRSGRWSSRRRGSRRKTVSPSRRPFGETQRRRGDAHGSRNYNSPYAFHSCSFFGQEYFSATSYCAPACCTPSRRRTDRSRRCLLRCAQSYRLYRSRK